MKNILNTIYTIASGHTSVNQVEKGDIFKINGLSNIEYPLVWIDILNAEMAENTFSNVFRLYAIDRISDNVNDIEIQSDMMHIAEDIIRNLAFYYDVVVTPSSFNPFIEQFNDLCSGIYIDLTVLNKRNFDNCDNPTTILQTNNYLSGNTLNNYSIAGVINKNIQQDLRLDYLESVTGGTGNFYTKTEINSYTGQTNSLINNKLNTSTFNSFTGTTLSNNFYNKSQINTYTGQTDSEINYISGITNTKLNISTFNSFTGTTLLNNYYSKSQINSYTGNTGAVEYISYDCSDLTTDLALNNNVAGFPVPFNCTLLGVFGALDTVASGATFIADIYYSGATIFGANKINIESNRYTSLTSANQPTLSVVNWLKGVKLNTRITQVGVNTKGKGLTIHLMMKRT